MLLSFTLSVSMALLQCIILSPSLVNISLLYISKLCLHLYLQEHHHCGYCFLKHVKEFCFNMGLTNHPVSDVLHSHPACFKQVNTSLKLAKNHDTIIKYYWWKKLKKKKVVSGIWDILPLKSPWIKIKILKKNIRIMGIRTMSIELENNCVKIDHQVIVNPSQNLTAICLPFQPHLHDCHVVQTMSFKMHHPGLSN